MHVVKVECHLSELHRNSLCNLDEDTVDPDGWVCLRHPDRPGKLYWDYRGNVCLENCCVCFCLHNTSPFFCSLIPLPFFPRICMLFIGVCISTECLVFALVCVSLFWFGPSRLQTSAPVMREFGSIAHPHPWTRRTSVLAYALLHRSSIHTHIQSVQLRGNSLQFEVKTSECFSELGWRSRTDAKSKTSFENCGES